MPVSNSNSAHARVQSKLLVRPEESLQRDSEVTLRRLHQTVQVTKPVWSLLTGSRSNVDVHGRGFICIESLAGQGERSDQREDNANEESVTGQIQDSNEEAGTDDIPIGQDTATGVN